ncbi:Hypothetical leucine rich repeat protein (Partial), partial [Ectocarpus siliculosus]
MPSEDRAALVALFRSTGGTLWKHNAYWDTDAKLSQWYGVYVNQDGRVKELRLSRNNLKGILILLRTFLSMPAALLTVCLAFVQSPSHHKWFIELKVLVSSILWLIRRRLIVPSYASTDNINIGQAQPVPTKRFRPIPGALGALKELLYLRLSGNKFTGSIPARLGSLQKLQRLWLNDNQLAGPIPEALGALTELTNLLLSYNKLTAEHGCFRI